MSFSVFKREQSVKLRAAISVSAKAASIYTSCPPVTLATCFSWCRGPGSCSVLYDVLSVFVAVGVPFLRRRFMCIASSYFYTHIMYMYSYYISSVRV